MTIYDSIGNDLAMANQEKNQNPKPKIWLFSEYSSQWTNFSTASILRIGNFNFIILNIAQLELCGLSTALYNYS